MISARARASCDCLVRGLLLLLCFKLRRYRRRIIRHFPPLKSVARGGNFTQKSDAFLPISVILVSLPSDMSDDVTPMLVHDSWNLYRGVSDLA